MKHCASCCLCLQPCPFTSRHGSPPFSLNLCSHLCSRAIFTGKLPSPPCLKVHPQGLRSTNWQLQKSHRDVKYSLKNILNKTVITIHGVRRILDLLKGSCRKLQKCLTPILYTQQIYNIECQLKLKIFKVEVHSLPCLTFFIAHISFKHTNLFYCTIRFPPLECKLQRGRNFCLFYSLLLAQCLT